MKKETKTFLRCFFGVHNFKEIEKETMDITSINHPLGTRTQKGTKTMYTLRCSDCGDLKFKTTEFMAW